jgi:glycogen debranching enzyme
MARASSPQIPGYDHEEPEFLVATVDASARVHQTLKHDDAFVILDAHGDIGAAGNTSDGLFFKDTRHISRLELLMERSAPLLLGSALDRTDLQLCSDLTNPDVFADGELWLQKDAIHVFRTSYVRDGAIRQRLVFTNHSSAELSLTVNIIFDCDFADIFEVRGMHRARRGVLERKIQSTSTVNFDYSGLDGVKRHTMIRFEPEPHALKETAAFFRFELPHNGSATLFFTGTATAGAIRSPPACSYLKGLRDAHRSLRQAESAAASIDVSNPELDYVLKKAMADLRLLTTNTEDGPYPYAGTPWYSTTFGRDALITALQILWLDPSIARGVLRRLARYQASKYDAEADAQPGKILHEMRDGEMAALREIPFGLYYGSVDATPLFIVVAGAYLGATGDKEFLGEIWPSVLRALEWIDGPGDLDQDGFVEYARETDAGLSNQGWKDSHDAIFHTDGTLASGPIALVEVQGYVYAAKIAAAAMASELGLDTHARELLEQAAALQRKFEQAFWCEDTGFYALALDGDKKPVRTRASNAGHMLATGIAGKNRAARVIEELLKPNFFSGWGIRTIATTEARYNPMSYHNGSIWPHDNAMIAAGLARYGFKDGVETIFSGLFDAALTMDQRRLPELYCGFRRRSGRAPILYPVACSPQAWASGALLHVVSSMLGFVVDASKRTLKLHAPYLPERAGTISIRNMRIGEGSADFTLRHKNGSMLIDVTNCKAGANVLME